VADLLDNRTEFMRFTNLWEGPNGDIPWTTMKPIFSLLSHPPPTTNTRTARTLFKHGTTSTKNLLSPPPS
jgi:hypothetical protein